MPRWSASGAIPVTVGRSWPTRKATSSACTPALTLDHAAVSAYRTAVMHLDDRLGLGEDDHVVAAFGGLHDSAPRSGLLALHARMEGVGPGSWQDQRLLQVWFRWADYLVPRRDVGLFALGCSLRNGNVGQSWTASLTQ